MISRFKNPLNNLKIISRITEQHTCLTTKPSLISTATRNYRVSAAKYKGPLEKKAMPSADNDNTTPIQSDLSGLHKIASVQSCTDQTQCHIRKCDSIHEKICPYSPKDPNLLAELGGTLTHKIPAGKEGIVLDPFDANGDNKKGPQYLVKEKTTVPLDLTKFKEDEKTTEYVQQEFIAERIKKSLPSNSILLLKNTSIIDTPLDEDH